MSGKPRKRPSTQAQRDAMTFQGEKIVFDWTNDDWVKAHLVTVRVACVIMGKDHEQLQSSLASASISESCAVSEMLEQMTLTKKHLKALVELLDRSLLRSFLLLERLGYSPDNPPPDGPVFEPHTRLH